MPTDPSIASENDAKKFAFPNHPNYDKLIAYHYLETFMAERMRKEQAHKLVDKMPDDSTWDDLINEIYVRQVIDQRLADSKAGRTTDVKDVRKKYGLTE